MNRIQGMGTTDAVSAVNAKMTNNDQSLVPSSSFSPLSLGRTCPFLEPSEADGGDLLADAASLTLGEEEITKSFSSFTFCSGTQSPAYRYKMFTRSERSFIPKRSISTRRDVKDLTRGPFPSLCVDVGPSWPRKAPMLKCWRARGLGGFGRETESLLDRGTVSSNVRCIPTVPNTLFWQDWETKSWTLPRSVYPFFGGPAPASRRGTIQKAIDSCTHWAWTS